MTWWTALSCSRMPLLFSAYVWDVPMPHAMSCIAFCAEFSDCSRSRRPKIPYGNYIVNIVGLIWVVLSDSSRPKRVGADLCRVWEVPLGPLDATRPSLSHHMGVPTSNFKDFCDDFFNENSRSTVGRNA